MLLPGSDAANSRALGTAPTTPSTSASARSRSALSEVFCGSRMTALHETDRGPPQGAGISPLLANIFLHYVLDLWVHQWRRRHAHGRVVIVRYADDFVMGFEKADDARRMMAALRERLAKFGLAIHEGKTRLIEFGRLPALIRQQRGLRRPETFAFLGFTHYCGWTRDGRFIVKLKTQSKRLTRKLKALRQEAWRLMHASLTVQHRWYTSVLLGH